MSRKEIKEKARQTLGNGIFTGKWMLALVAVLIVGVIIGVVSFTYVGEVLLYGPLTIGLSAAILKASREQESTDIGYLFKSAFNNQFGRNFLVGFMTELFICLWSLLLVIPGIVKAYSYSMAQYIAADHPEYSWKECIDESRKLMDGHKAELFVLDLSFIGWFLVGSLVCGVGTLWVSAYQLAARTEFYRALIGDAEVYATAEEAPAEEAPAEEPVKSIESIENDVEQ